MNKAPEVAVVTEQPAPQVLVTVLKEVATQGDGLSKATTPTS